MRGNRVLIISSSGGSGHHQAALVKKNEILEEDPTALIVEMDVLIDWYKPVGRLIKTGWNTSQKKGWVFLLHAIYSMQFLSEIFYWPQAFFYCLRALLKMDIDRIIDTQPLNTSAILAAIRIANWKLKKDLILEKVVIELPTKKVKHYFLPIKLLSKASKAHLHLITTKPLLTSGESNDTFWNRECGLSEEAIKYQELPIRTAFKNKRNYSLKGKTLSLSIKLHSQYEKKLIMETLARSHLKASFLEKQLDLSIPSNAKVLTLMLGSQPAERGTISYVRQFILMKKVMKHTNRVDYLFACCSYNDKGRSPLLEMLHHLVLGMQEFPKNLCIVPLPFQGDEVIAPLFKRSDATLTRSGGITSMELLTIATGNIWIHSEGNDKALIKGMPVWEGGNALYLQAKKGAKLTNPDLFSSLCASYLTDPLLKISDS